MQKILIDLLFHCHQFSIKIYSECIYETMKHMKNLHKIIRFFEIILLQKKINLLD